MANGVPIMLGSMKGIGTVVPDPELVRGEGGPSTPQLVVPLEFAIPSQPSEPMYAVVSLKAWLGTESTVWPHSAVCPPAVQLLVGGDQGFLAYSLPNNQKRRVDLRFFLTAAQVEALEDKRHAAGAEGMTLYVQLDPVVVALKTFNEMSPGRQPDFGPLGLPMNVGIYADVVGVFWTASISTLSVRVETSRWVREVLPGLGYDKVRLVQVKLPHVLPEHPSAAVQFDKARTAIDGRRYEDAVAACRGLLKMWSDKLGGSSKDPVSKVVGDERGWVEDDPRRKFLDGVWKAATDFVNASHHPEGSSQPLWLDYSDARLAWMLVGLLSEYLGSLRP